MHTYLQFGTLNFTHSWSKAVLHGKVRQPVPKVSNAVFPYPGNKYSLSTSEMSLMKINVRSPTLVE